MLLTEYDEVKTMGLVKEEGRKQGIREGQVIVVKTEIFQRNGQLNKQK